MSDATTTSTPDKIRVTRIRKKLEVTITDENGTDHDFWLLEMVGSQRDHYLSGQATKLKFNDKGQPVGVTDVNGSQTGLIAKCLYKDEKGKEPVPEKEIVQFPGEAIDTLFVACRKLNALDKKSEEEEKKG